MNKIIKQVSAKVTYNTELPYSIRIGDVRAIGDSPKSAVIAALSVGKLIPSEIRSDENAILDFLEMNYENSSFRNVLINTIRCNKIV